ncbi:hypothetical protein DOQ08_01459 [Marinobacter litoralis]|uniref:LTXXQ motif protein n=1 Tax=Marinobacter litoralis TaxID=187981 RepID=A0A3M2RG53_9GAMM|nr:hypothetical protein [Marinobacter litoralis]RMJ04139.1 hypothetical protein DOQ08_01459 [Marinobacter litoralis]
MKVHTSVMTAGVLMAALFAASPAALAHDHKGMDHHEGKRDKKEMCEDFREGKGKFSKEHREERQKEMQEHRAEMADRLMLTDEQRVIWSEIHDERMEKWQKKMEKRCDDMK